MILDTTVYLDEHGTPYDPNQSGLKSGRQLAPGTEVPDDLLSPRPLKTPAPSKGPATNPRRVKTKGSRL